jgi:hypothetical protein
MSTTFRFLDKTIGFICTSYSGLLINLSKVIKGCTRHQINFMNSSLEWNNNLILCSLFGKWNPSINHTCSNHEFVSSITFLELLFKRRIVHIKATNFWLSTSEFNMKGHVIFLTSLSFTPPTRLPSTLINHSRSSWYKQGLFGRSIVTVSTNLQSGGWHGFTSNN